MDNGINLVVFSWLLGFAVFACLQLSKGVIRCVHILYIVHFVFCGFPLLLDVIFGMPQYRNEPGYSLASSDSDTFYVYCLYVSFVPLLWTFTAMNPSRCMDRAGAELSRVPRGFGRFGTLTNVAILMLPIILVIASPRPEVYLTYGMIATEQVASEEIIKHDTLVTASVFLGLLSIAGILLNTKKLNVRIVGSCVLLTCVYIWLNGKRNSLFESLLVYLYVGFARGALRGRRLVICSVAIVICMSIYSAFYQSYIRRDILDFSDPDDKYTNIRIDYGRDAVIKFTLYCELKGGSMRILDYRGQSVLFNFLYFVPRKWNPEKPWPYAQYLTAAMLFTNTPPIDWSMTTSWLEESIANFSWAGVLIGPLCLSIICRLADHAPNRSTQGIGILVGSLLLAVQLSAFMVLALIWCAIVVKERIWG